MAGNRHHSYRPELDGMRAIAVLAVILFHLHSGWLPGGFVGVDVFFVLSGYLITGLLRRSMRDGRFRFRDFFLRRVRRLTPPLFTALVGATLGAVFLLPPALLEDYAWSLVWQPVALQNMYFFTVGDYFHAPGDKPLLHTWSLGVEEQFYLVWPFVILALSRVRREAAMAGLAMISILSWVLCLLLPEVTPKAGFFLFPARAWELGIGGLLAVWQEHERSFIRRIPGTPLGILSLIGLALSIGLFDESMPFPSWPAVLPVLATAGCIAATSNAAWLVRILSIRPLVWIGLGSYALYLWHWPLIVFANQSGLSTRSMPIAVAVTAGSALAAYVSYCFIEEPIRRRRVLASDGQLFTALGGVALALFATTAVVTSTNGLSLRYDPPRRGMLEAPLSAAGDGRCGLVWRAMNPGSELCHLSGNSAGHPILLWGNSHAAMWVDVLGELANERPVFLNARNCRPMPHSGYCDAAYVDGVFEEIVDYGIADVVLASSWWTLSGSDSRRAKRVQGLTDTVQRLDALGVRIWLVVDVPTHPDLDPVRAARDNPAITKHPSIERNLHEPLRVQTRRAFKPLADTYPSVRLIDPTDAFCDAETCRSGLEDVTWYRDDNHLTAAGARHALPSFSPVMDR